MEYKLTENCTVDLNELFGHGGTGQVYRGTIHTSVAVKKVGYRKSIAFRKLADPDEKIIQLAKQEIETFKKLNKHPNILQLLDYKDDGRSYWLILEFCDLGDLQQYVYTHNPDIYMKINVMLGCAKGLQYMHCNFYPPVIHGDIKPSNILLKRANNEDVVKLSDFSGPGILVTRTFLPPEAFQSHCNKTNWSLPGDVFSLGLVYNVLLLYSEDRQTMTPVPYNVASPTLIRSIGAAMAEASEHGSTIPLLFPTSFGQDNTVLSALRNLTESMIRFTVEERETMNGVLEIIEQMEYTVSKTSPSSDSISKIEYPFDAEADGGDVSTKLDYTYRDEQDSVLGDFYLKYKIHENTKHLLKKHDLNNLEDLSEVTEPDLMEIGVSLGQRKAVQRGILEYQQMKLATTLPQVQEMRRDPENHIRLCHVKCQDHTIKEISRVRTLLLVGDTGTGKSTIVNRIVNLIFNVTWYDKIKIKITDLTNVEKEHTAKGQAVSQTSWITVYSIVGTKENRLDFNFNIIDTPGFKRTDHADDTALINQLKVFKNLCPQFSVEEIHAIGLVQKYKTDIKHCDLKQSHIYRVIKSLFEVDENNVFHIITFADLLACQNDKFGHRLYLVQNTEESVTTEYEKHGLNQHEINRNCWNSAMQTYKILLHDVAVIVSTKIIYIRSQYYKWNIKLFCLKLTRLEQEISKLEELRKKPTDDSEYEIMEETIVHCKSLENNLLCNLCKVNCHVKCNCKRKFCIVLEYPEQCHICKCARRDHSLKKVYYDINSRAKRKTISTLLERYDVKTLKDLLIHLKKECDIVKEELRESIDKGIELESKYLKKRTDLVVDIHGKFVRDFLAVVMKQKTYDSKCILNVLARLGYMK